MSCGFCDLDDVVNFSSLVYKREKQKFHLIRGEKYILVFCDDGYHYRQVYLNHEDDDWNKNQ